LATTRSPDGLKPIHPIEMIKMAMSNPKMVRSTHGFSTAR